MEKIKTSFTPCHLSSFRPSPCVETCWFFFEGGDFLEVFATVSVQQYQLLMFLVFFVFLFLGLLGEIFTLTNIHWHSFHPSTFHIDVFIELLILATEPPEKMYSKRALSPTSSGTPLD